MHKKLFGDTTPLVKTLIKIGFKFLQTNCSNDFDYISLENRSHGFYTVEKALNKLNKLLSMFGGRGFELQG